MKNQEELEGIIAEVAALEAALGEDRCSVCLMHKRHSLLDKIASVMGRKKRKQSIILMSSSWFCASIANISLEVLKRT